MNSKRSALLSVCVLAFLQSAASACHAQTAALDPPTALRQELIDHQFVLKNMSGSPTLHGTWDGKAVNLDVPSWHTFAALSVRKVQLKKSELKIEGDRRQIIRNNAGKLLLGTQETHVVLTLTVSGDPATLASSLRNALFFPDLDTALAAVPKDFRQHIPPPEDGVDKPVRHPSDCDCADTRDACTGLTGSGMRPPKALSTVGPDLTEEMQKNKINASGQIGVRLDETGAIADEWLVHDLGYGLDEAEALAVRQFKFAPAACHSKPVGAVVFVDTKVSAL